MAIFDNLVKRRDLISEEIKELFKEECKNFLVKFPWVEAIKFTAYRPYFNDGDACLYSVAPFDVCLNAQFKKDNKIFSYYDLDQGVEELENIEDDLKAPSSFYGESVDHLRSEYGDNPLVKEMVSNIRELQNFPDDIAQSLFGEDASVTITINGIDIEFFQHD